ncbi:MAG: hypothetical protein J0H18_03205 [Rhizobiales bacterium]|nr:hypothetical protein [Hyphomicrobiales bacterium]OJY06666.1 MAG: hypothetical protein BGP07_16610 [Rhizobiales bacterium 63-22]
MTASPAPDFTIFGMYVDRKRILDRMTPGAVAGMCRIPADDVNRVISGRPIGEESFHALCGWLGREPSFFAVSTIVANRRALP